MFNASLTLSEARGLAYVHVFPYSASAGYAGCAHAATARSAGDQARGGAAQRCDTRPLRTSRPAHRPFARGTERRDTGRSKDFALVRFRREVAPGALLIVAADGADGRATLAIDGPSPQRATPPTRCA